MDEHALVREQAAQLKAAFDTGMLCRTRLPGADEWVEQHEPVVAALRPDYVFSVQEHRGHPCVVVEFGLDGDPPGVRWLHRFAPPTLEAGGADGLPVFQEGVECGWIGRSLARVPPGTSPVWTDFSWGHPSRRWHEAMQLVEAGRLHDAIGLLEQTAPDHEVQGQADLIRELAGVEDATTARALRDRIWRTFRQRSLAIRDADRAATRAFLREHRRDNGSWSGAWS